jgi:hypothetical protein
MTAIKETQLAHFVKTFLTFADFSRMFNSYMQRRYAAGLCKSPSLFMKVKYVLHRIYAVRFFALNKPNDLKTEVK